MKKILISFLFFAPQCANSQTEKFDIATFISPKGWQRSDSNGVVIFHNYRTQNGLTSFCQIILYPSRTGKSSPEKNFREEWDNRVAKTTGSKAKPKTVTEKTPEGWTVVTGSADIFQNGISYTCMLVSMSGFDKIMSVRINIAGQDYTEDVKVFFENMDLHAEAGPGVNWNNEKPPLENGTVTSNDYSYIPPEGWQLQKNKDHLFIQNMQSGCAIRILEPQPFSGNLGQDAKAVFDMMYAGWQYQKTGEQQYVLSKSFLPKGLEYCMMEAAMSMTGADGRYNLEEGAALVVKAGNQIVIISVRHNSSLIAHDDCRLKYNTWKRFFNSFTVKNVVIPKNEEDVSNKIVGAWSQTESGASSEYVFAANGNYALIGAIGSTHTSSDYRYEYLHIKTYAFQGDGSYTLSGNQLTLKKRSDSPQQVRVRFEKLNRGGTGWKDRLYMLKPDPTLGTMYEVCYEKRDK